MSIYGAITSLKSLYDTLNSSPCPLILALNARGNEFKTPLSPNPIPGDKTLTSFSFTTLSPAEFLCLSKSNS